MKSGKFIIYPGYTAKEHSHPWHTDKRVYNNRSLDLLPGPGLQTFLKTFTVRDGIKSATLRITSLGIFEAMLNGHRIGTDGTYDELMPLWTDYRHRVFEIEYDLMPYIKKHGENTFAARISNGWWAGRISFGFYGFKAPSLCAEIELLYKDGASDLIATDETWKASVAGPVLAADIWDGEYFDARIVDPAVNPKNIEWKGAELFDDYTCEITPFEGERVRVNEYVKPVSAVVWRNTQKNGSDFGEIIITKKIIGNGCETLLLRAGQHLMLDFGQNIVGRPSLALKAASGVRIDCLFAEMLNDSGDRSRGNDGPKGSIYIENYRSALSRLTYIAASTGSRKQLNIFKPLHTFYGFRYIEITADHDIEIKCVTGEIVGSCLDGLGSFECSNAEINKLYSNIEWGMKGNYLSAPTDCPQRDERLGWTGDTQIFCGAASYISDTYSFLRRWLSDARDSQRGYDGAYCDVIPRVFTHHGGNAAWGDAGLIVTYKLWLMYGNEEVVAENYDAMEYYMRYLEQFGLEGPNTAYGDWLNYDVTDKRYIAICYYAYDASLMEKFSHILGKTERAEYYHDLFERIVEHYYEKYVKDGEIQIKTQTGYLLPLAFDMLDSELREKSIRLLKNKIIDNDYTLSTGFVGTGILNQTLSKLGLDALAYSLLLQTADPSWLYSVRQGATTVWERWNSYTKETGFGNVGMNSFNHYAYGAVAEWMYSSMAGILPDENDPGFNAHFILSPRPDTRSDDELPKGQSRITMASASYRGISSRWEYDNDRFVWSFVIPQGSSATIEFPLLNTQKAININGVDFTQKELQGSIKNGKLVFELKSGHYIAK